MSGPSAKMRFTILGCGSSPGTPRINGDWGACDPENPRNRRSRCSLLVERITRDGTTTVVIDTSPDFRAQMLAAKVQHLDGVLYTHPHADHIHGIDDLRQYAIIQHEQIKVYADRPTLDHLEKAFTYCFKAINGAMYPPICEANEIHPGIPVRIEGEGGPIDFLPVRQIHGPIHSLAFRVGDFAYSSDVSDIPEESVQHFQGLDMWVLDALQYRNHISHFSLDQALEWINRMKPREALLTHMHIPLDYETVQGETPAHVQPAYDGLVMEYET